MIVYTLRNSSEVQQIFPIHDKRCHVFTFNLDLERRMGQKQSDRTEKKVRTL